MESSIKKFKVYKSSAGSGKTFTLVKEFLRLCLLSSDLYGFSRILAITFTNKATYEMKHRILLALKDIGAGNKNGEVYKNVLVLETGLSDAEVQSKSSNILTAILHSYADFSISTIDKFTHRLIRTFSKDLGLAPNFNVELDEQRVLKEVVDLLIDTIGRDKRLTDLILQFTFARIEEEKSWKIDQELVEFAKDILKEKSKPYLKSLRGLTSKNYDETILIFSKIVKSFEHNIEKLAQEGLNLINEQGIDHGLFAGNAKISVYLRRLANLQLAYIEPSNQLIKNIENNKWTATKATSADVAAIETIKERLEEIFYAIQDLKTDGLANYISASAVLKNIHSLSLLNYIEQKLEEYKKQEGIIQISDFNDLIGKVVENEPMPFIYERLGDKYKHVMIDEFQDTSVKQFSNLLPLVEDSLSRGNENLLVGDAKQSIYRFRGGEVSQFSEMPNYKLDEIEQNDLYDLRMETLKVQFDEKFLDTNWRSQQNVVKFNNEFFDFILRNGEITPKIEAIYKGHNQIAAAKVDEGFVSIEFVEGIDAEEKQNAYFDSILNRIEEALSEGFLLKDIAILVRKNSHAKSVAEFLKSQKIPVVSSDALLLKNDPVVSFLINFSAWIFDRNTHLYQKNIIQFLSEQGFLKGEFSDNLDRYMNQFEFSTLFDELGVDLKLDEIRLKSAHEFYESIIRCFSLDATYNVYVQFFQDEVLDYFKSNKATIPQFLEWWLENEEKLSISVDEGINAIQLLTIHKSKGLEFHVVIMPFATQDIKFSGGVIKKLIWTENIQDPENTLPYALVEYKQDLKDSEFAPAFNVEFEKNQIDLVNDVYVGFTRAVDKLHLISEKKSASNRKNRTLNLCDLLEDFTATSDLMAEKENSYEFGKISPSAIDNKPETKESTEYELEYLSEAWNNKIKVANSAISQWKQSEEIQFGVMIHELLGDLNNISDLPKVIEKQYAQGAFTKEEVDFFTKKIGALLNNSTILPFFEKGLKVQNEADLLNAEGKILRPDRVVFFDNRIAILDFKTGEKNESHHAQVNEYIHALKEIEQNKNVEGYILYTEIGELEKV